MAATVASLRSRVGICEDDAELRSVLTRALESDGFEVRAVRSGHEAVQTFTGDVPEVLVLDIGLPDSDGRDVCQALRARGVDAPVIFLTAAGGLSDRLAGFNAGGDDYLSKPFALEELLVRIRALLRRSSDAGAPRPEGTLHLDPAAHAVRVGERQQSLTPTEFRLLAALAARPGEVVRRRELVAAGWPDGAIVHENTLDTYIARLRRKLRTVESPEKIENARRVGYVLK